MERQASDCGLTAVQYRTLKRFVQQGGRGLTGKLRWDGDVPDYRNRKRPDWLDPEALFVLESRRILVHEWEYPEPASGRPRRRYWSRRYGWPEQRGWYSLTTHGREVAIALGLAAAEADADAQPAPDERCPTAGGAGRLRYKERLYWVARRPR